MVIAKLYYSRVCPGIHKVRVGPATRSAVATCSIENIKKFKFLLYYNRIYMLTASFIAQLKVHLNFFHSILEHSKPFQRHIHPEELWWYKNQVLPDTISSAIVVVSKKLCNNAPFN